MFTIAESYSVSFNSVFNVKTCKNNKNIRQTTTNQFVCAIFYKKKKKYAPCTASIGCN